MRSASTKNISFKPKTVRTAANSNNYIPPSLPTSGKSLSCKRAAASSLVLRKPQTWTLEPDPGPPPGKVVIKNHENLYLVTDFYGNLRCTGLRQLEATRFEIEVCQLHRTDKVRFWRFKVADGSGFLIADKIGLRILARTVDKSDMWLVHLAAHPHMCLRNLARNKYARYANKEFRLDQVTPWGQDSLVTLEWHPEQGGRYAIRAHNGQYLTRLGVTREEISVDTLFFLEFHRGYMAIRDCRGWYLTAMGPTGGLSSRASTVGKNELFLIEENPLQLALTAINGKYVSCRGVDLLASKDSITDYEVFNLEMSGNNRYLKTIKETYWTVHHHNGSLQANQRDRTAKESEFNIDWNHDGGLSIQSNDSGKYVTAKANGHMFANSADKGASEMFYFTIVNRPILILRCPFGYVGFRSLEVPRMECNRAEYDVITMVPGPYGNVYFKASNNKFFNVHDDGTVYADSNEPKEFRIAVRGNSRITIQTNDGHYLRANQSGPITADGRDAEDNTQWEFTGRYPGGDS